MVNLFFNIPKFEHIIVDDPIFNQGHYVVKQGGGEGGRIKDLFFYFSPSFVLSLYVYYCYEIDEKFITWR